MVASETRDGEGAGDHDTAFVWGNALVCLRPIDRARLLILRGYIKDAKAGERGGPGDGDLGWTVTTDSEVILPLLPSTSEAA